MGVCVCGWGWGGDGGIGGDMQKVDGGAALGMQEASGAEAHLSHLNIRVIQDIFNP